MLGGTLYELISDHGKLEEQRATLYFKQIIDGIEFCHRKNVIHRDLKPPNILFSDKEQTLLKLSDFGLAVKTPDGANDWYGHAGTAGYMAPEVLNRQKYGKAVDIWALGAILFFMLSAEQAFWDENVETLRNLTKEGNFSFGPIWDGISSILKVLISKMLEVKQDARITLRDIKKELKNI